MRKEFRRSRPSRVVGVSSAPWQSLPSPAHAAQGHKQLPQSRPAVPSAARPRYFPFARYTSSCSALPSYGVESFFSLFVRIVEFIGRKAHTFTKGFFSLRGGVSPALRSLGRAGCKRCACRARRCAQASVGLCRQQKGST